MRAAQAARAERSPPAITAVASFTQRRADASAHDHHEITAFHRFLHARQAACLLLRARAVAWCKDFFFFFFSRPAAARAAPPVRRRSPASTSIRRSTRQRRAQQAKEVKQSSGSAKRWKR